MNIGTSARKNTDIIDMQSYESGYASGYTEGEKEGYESGYYQCRKEFHEKIMQRKKKKAEYKRRQFYFLKQKMIGVLLLLVTIWAVMWLEGDVTIAILTIPIALLLIFSKEKCWMNQYYFECDDMERGENFAQRSKN